MDFTFIKNRKKYFHIACSAILSLICMWDRVQNIPKFPYCFLYETQIALYSTTFYFCISTFYDINNKIPPKIVDKIFNFSFADSAVASLMFWILYFNDKGNVIKKDIEFSFALACLLHGGVFLLTILEILLGNLKKNMSYLSFWFYMGFLIIYTSLLYFNYHIFGIKVYPYATKSITILIFVNLLGFIICMIFHYAYIKLNNHFQKVWEKIIKENDNYLNEGKPESKYRKI